MELREAYLKMIRAFNGGWDAIAPALGMTRNALQNRIYENQGQRLHVETALAMQAMSGTTHFAEAIATASGGTFVALPSIDAIENDSIQSKFNEAYAELGRLFNTFVAAAEDGVIDDKERRQLQALGEDMHRKTEQLLALMFHVYCAKTQVVKINIERGAA